jgi:hypothetical protein
MKLTQQTKGAGMTDDRFWQLIEQARAGSDASASPKRMAEVLRALSDADILAFASMLYDRLCDLNEWQLWGAGYVIAGGMSDDGFHYFRSWIVGKGRHVFELARRNPDDLAPFVDDPSIDNELLEYVGMDVLRERGIDQDPRDNATGSADDFPSGTQFDENTVRASYPKLASAFSEK